MADQKKTVFITGCSSGIGRHLALTFHAHGLRVFATARNADSLSELRELSHDGIETLSLTVDDPASVEACYQELRTKLGPGKGLDYLVHNAGRNCTVPATDVSIDEAKDTFATNFFAVVHINQVFMPLLLQAKGTIVNIGSIAGVFPFIFGSIYNASKSALHQYASTLRLELAPYQVHVLTIITGGVISNIARSRAPLPPTSIMQPFAAAYKRRITHSQAVGQDTAEYAESVVKGVLGCRGRFWNANEVWAGAKAGTVWWADALDRWVPGGVWRWVVPRMLGVEGRVEWKGHEGEGKKVV